MSELRLRFLGSGDAFGSGGRFQTCLHLEGPDGNLLIDCGASSLIAMKRGGLSPGDIGWVLVTHLHGDHFAGLPFLVLDGQFSGRTRPLVVAGPPGIRARVEAAMEVLFPGSARVARRFALEFLELPERVPSRVGPVDVTPFAVVHASGAPACALRVEYGGRVIAYSGVCEAYFFEKKVRYHLDYRTLRAERARLECARLVLTHMSNDMLARLDEVDVEAAEDGRVITLTTT